jgi:hypothetical protein
MDYKETGIIETPGSEDSWRTKLHHSVYKKKIKTLSQRDSVVT